MNDVILPILGSLAFVIFWDMNNLWNPYLKFKPFNCVPCLSAWVAMILFILPNEFSELFIAVFGVGVLAPLVIYYLKQL